MKRKLIALVLVLSFLLPYSVVAAEEIEVANTIYYSLDVTVTDSGNPDNIYTEAVDIMILPLNDQLFINGEDLQGISGYYFKYSEKDCSYAKIPADELVDEANEHVLYFKYNTDKMIAYFSGKPISYTMPYPARYVDGVPWIPMDFAMNMLNMYYYITDSGMSCTTPHETVLSVAHKIQQGTLGFDFAGKTGASDWAMLGMETGAFLINLGEGLRNFEPSAWATLLTGIFGNKYFYDAVITEKVCDLFVCPAENEFATTVANLYAVPIDITKTTGAIRDWENIRDSKLFGGGKFGKIADKLVGTVNDIADDTVLAKAGDTASFTTLDYFKILLDIAAVQLQFEGRSEMCVRALKQYGEETSTDMGLTIRSYAFDASIPNDTAAALLRYFKENAMNICAGTLELGPGMLLNIGWSLVSGTIPYLSNTIHSAEHFSICQQATALQNDAYEIFSEHYKKALSSKNFNETYLEKVAMESYIYLKFALIARESAASCIKDGPDISQEYKDSFQKIMDREIKQITRYMSIVSLAEEGSGDKVNNKLGEYNGLLPSEMGEYRRNLDETDVIYKIGKVATLIKASVTETPPVEIVVITEEEAIAMVRNSLNKYTMGMMNGPLEEYYDFRCIDLCYASVIDLENEDALEENAIFETDYCYIIALYVADTPDAVFCVSADGTGAYIASGYGEGYGFLREFNLADLKWSDVGDVFRKLGVLLMDDFVEQ